MEKTVNMTVRFTEKQYQEVLATAKASGVPASTWVRMHAIEAVQKASVK